MLLDYFRALFLKRVVCITIVICNVPPHFTLAKEIDLQFSSILDYFRAWFHKRVVCITIVICNVPPHFALAKEIDLQFSSILAPCMSSD